MLTSYSFKNRIGPTTSHFHSRQFSVAVASGLGESPECINLDARLMQRVRDYSQIFSNEIENSRPDAVADWQK